jgi:hypothetical protein
VLAAAAVLSVALAGAITSAQDSPPKEAPEVWGAEWAFRPDGLGEMTERSSAAVLAEVVAVKRGPDLVAGSPTDPGGQFRLPTQRIELRTVRQLEGSAPGTFTLFKNGSEDLYLEADPLYAVSERYVLFVRRRDASDGTYLPVAPDGRLRVESSGRLKAFIDGPATDRLEGKTVDQADQEVADAR